MLLGLEITKTHLEIAAIDLTGKLMCHEQIVEEFSMTDKYARYLGEVITEFLKKELLSSEKVLGVGVSIPGIIDESGKVVSDSHALGLTNIIAIFKIKAYTHKNGTI